MQKRGILLVAILFVVSFGAGYFFSLKNLEPQQEHSYYNEAWNLYRNGELPAALTSFETQLQKDPNNEYALIGKGWSLHRLNRFNEAIASFEQASAARSGFFDAQAGLARSYLSSFKEDLDNPELSFEAKKHLINAIEMDPSRAANYRLYYGIGRLLYLESLSENDSKKMSQALGYLNQSLRYNALSPSVHAAIGWVYFTQDDYSLAENEFKTSLKIDSRNELALSGLANTYFTLGNLSQARLLFETLIAKYPQSPMIRHYHHSLGVIEAVRGNIPEAMEHYDAALKIRPGRPLYLQSKGWALISQGNYDEALALFEEVMARTDPGYDMAETGRGLALLKLNRYDEAISSFERVIKTEDHKRSVLSARIWLLAIHYERDDLAQAQAQAIAIKSMLDNPTFIQQGRFSGTFYQCIDGDFSVERIYGCKSPRKT